MRLRNRRTQAAQSLASRTGPRFLESVAASGIVLDDGQRRAIDEIAGSEEAGIYLYGPAGRGKTVLATLFFDAIPELHKVRIHFHNFLADIQTLIARHGMSHQEAIQSVVGEARAVFFDEFHVHDVADAIYLTELLRTLCDGSRLIIATSNYAPADLLPNPLFHSRFLPAIDLITKTMTATTVGDGPDYRRRLVRSDKGFSSGTWISGSPEQITDSPTQVPLNADGIVLLATHMTDWAAHFTFTELCERPVGNRQYLWLADNFDAITMMGVPSLASADRDPLMRLANLVDILYDRDIRLDIESAGPPERILDAPSPPHDVGRTLSRLQSLHTTCGARLA
ncbi:cell division protein ZapE [Gordonia sp. (in: high G+C Gram-positive bacteria)]|uniref:cell division protein ZapE n=1 Tax=Gordonia sp. (in: high G+C Gram-positive bacteria) TaxID=84139 RepID=UPI001D60CC88|nr:cell division protein ZapE [Gordonia sp. (in: high G+C Gram-positive bacteria)]MCB1295786.1 cell division protein ZapE [Gordonia sp. (in: high G+C Gram-positive bacteria)]HMS77418.1 cell division protein ZapE [Gordonia sp. (in: high G+C Gram-positive bacteria)]